MRRLTVSLTAVAAGLALAACGSSGDSGSASSTSSSSSSSAMGGSSSSSAASPSSSSSSSSSAGAISAAAWCKLYREDPGLSNSSVKTVGDFTDVARKAIDKLADAGYPSDMPQSAQDALTKQTKAFNAALDGLKPYADKTIAEVRSNPDLKAKITKLVDSDTTDTPKSVSDYMDAHCTS